MATDFAPTFQKKYHTKVVPGLLMILDDDQNPRVQAHGGAALVNFAEDSPKNILLNFLPICQCRHIGDYKITLFGYIIVLKHLTLLLSKMEKIDFY